MQLITTLKEQKQWQLVGNEWCLGDNIYLDEETKKNFRNVSALGGIHILSQQCFKMSIEWPKGCPEFTGEVDFWACLVGYEFRGVQ
jgi:hypothetical protein